MNLATIHLQRQLQVQSSGATDTVTTIVAGDMKNGYVPVTDAITGVVKVFPFGINLH